MKAAESNMTRNAVSGFPARSLRLPVVFALLCSSLAIAGDTGLNVLALLAQDKKAVVKTAAGEMKAVAPGDVLTEQQLTVEKVMADKLVLTDNTNGDEVWIGVAAPGKNSEITRLSKQVQKVEMPEPVSIAIPLDNKNMKRSSHGQ